EQRCGDAVERGLVLDQELLGPRVLLGDDLAHLGVDLDRRRLREIACPLAELAAEEDLALLLAEGERPELLAHAPLADHAAGELGGVVDIALCARGDVLALQLLAVVTAHCASSY